MTRLEERRAARRRRRLQVAGGVGATLAGFAVILGLIVLPDTGVERAQPPVQSTTAPPAAPATSAPPSSPPPFVGPTTPAPPPSSSSSVVTTPQRTTASPARTPTPASPPPPAPPAPPVAPAAPEEDLPTGIDLVLADTNAARTAGGCQPLSMNPVLTAAAQAQSEAQSGQGRMFHSDGPPAGWTTTWAENVASGFLVEEVVDAWMNSAPHRANILNCSFTQIGLGLHGQYITQQFGG